MVLPAIPLAAMAILRLIAWLSSAILITSYVRDIVTKEPGETAEVSRDQTVEAILDDPNLTPEQKESTILKYLNISEPGDMEELKKYIPMAIIGFVLFGILRGK